LKFEQTLVEGFSQARRPTSKRSPPAAALKPGTEGLNEMAGLGAAKTVGS
jgi:hypothetical protein